MLTTNEQKFADHRQRKLDERDKIEQRVEADFEKMLAVFLALGLIVVILITYYNTHNFKN